MGLKNKMIEALNRLTTHIDDNFGEFLKLGKAQNQSLIDHTEQIGKMANLNGEMVALLQSIDSVQREILSRQEVLEAAICELSEGLYEEDEAIGYAEAMKSFDHPSLPTSSSLTRFLNCGVAVEVSWSEEDEVYLGRFVDKFPSLVCHGETEEETFETAKNLLEEVLRDMADEEGLTRLEPLVYCRSMDKTQGAVTTPPTIKFLDLFPEPPVFVPHDVDPSTESDYVEGTPTMPYRCWDGSRGVMRGAPVFVPRAIYPEDRPQTPDFADEVRSLLDYFGHDVQAMPTTEMLQLLEEVLEVSKDREQMAKAFMSTRELLNKDPAYLKGFGPIDPELSPQFIHKFISCVLSDIHSIKERLFDASYVFDLPRDGSAPTYGQIINAVREVIDERTTLKRQLSVEESNKGNLDAIRGMEAKKNG